MALYITLLFTVAFFAYISVSPGIQRPTTFRESIIENFNTYFEGDIILSPKDLNHFYNAVPKVTLLWPNAIIPYVIDASLDHKSELIRKAMDIFENKTCIKFKPRSEEDHYVKVFFGKGCFSNVGRLGGEQYTSLGDGCDHLGVVLHELMHSIGFFHMHSRQDRNDYIKINYDNIISNIRPQFQVVYEAQLLTKFDPDSVMMYGNTTGSINKSLITMELLDNTKYLIDTEEKNTLSPSDVEAINILYKCNETRINRL